MQKQYIKASPGPAPEDTVAKVHRSATLSAEDRLIMSGRLCPTNGASRAKNAEPRLFTTTKGG
jgi:hypothetical protein